MVKRPTKYKTINRYQSESLSSPLIWRNITRRVWYAELCLQMIQLGFTIDGCQDALRLIKELACYKFKLTNATIHIFPIAENSV
jgi:hypothetical protein